VVHAGDCDVTIFQGLTQGVEDVAVELGELVEEEDAVVGETDLAGPRNVSAPDEAGIGYAVMWGAERPCGYEGLVGAQKARNGVDLRGLHGLGVAETRHDGGETARKHGLARSGRSDHEDIVCPGGCHLEGPLGVPLDLEEMVGPEDGDVPHHGGFPAVAHGNDDGAHAFLPGEKGHGENTPDGFHGPVEGKLARYEMAFERLHFQGPHGGEDADGDGQVEGRAFLADIGRGEIDGYAVPGELEAGILYGGPDPLLALLHRGLGQSDDSERRQAVGDIHLHIDLYPVDPVNGSSGNACDHSIPPSMICGRKRPLPCITSRET